MATVPQIEPKIDIGRVLGKGFKALFANILPFGAVALLLAGLPAFLSQYLLWSGLATLDLNYIVSVNYWGPVAGAFFAMMLAGALLQGVLLRSTILHLSGRDIEVMQSVTLGLRLILPIIGVTICFGLLVTLGFIALIVPGIMIYCATIVAVPALVEERRGVFASISRSWELTKGSRLMIFVLLFLLGMISSSLSAIGGQISGETFNPVTETFPDPLLSGLTNAVVGSLTALITAVILAALYVELREIKEGVSPNDLADVFS